MKVCLLGGADSRLQAPFEDRSIEMWGVNNCYSGIPRATAWFEIHPVFQDSGVWYRRGATEFRGKKVGEYLQELDRLKVPVYMQTRNPLIERSFPYPLDKVLKSFPRKYFTCSISYMIALAILKGTEEIYLYGIEMGVEEYAVQRPGVEYFLGMAEGMGIRIYLSETSTLLHTPSMYGFGEMTHARMEARKHQVMLQIKKTEGEQCQRI